MNSSSTSREVGERAEVDHQAIREELERVLDSPIFAQSDRLARFLRLTVETTLAGEGATLKEYLIGTEVYDRKPPYHPSVDSIVRSEARRLRSKLRQYYESAGKDDPVFIYYRTGSYVPAFRTNRIEQRFPLTTHRDLRELLAEGLVAQTIDLSPGDREFEIQIIFEGTVRIVRSERKSSVIAGLTPEPEKNILGQDSASVAVSTTAATALRPRAPRSVRAERRSFLRPRKAGRVE
jgi:hypothetical protein